MVLDEILTTPALGLSTADAVAIATSQFGVFGEARRLTGERDDNFEISDGQRRYSLKVANPAELPTVLDMQQAALQHIVSRDSELPVPRPVPSLDGSLVAIHVHEATTTAVRMQTFLSGSPKDDSTDATRRTIGAMLARLHEALEGFDHGELRRSYLWNLTRLGDLASLVHHLAPDQQPIAERTIAGFVEEVWPRLSQTAAMPIHADFGHENILFDGDAVTGIIDFGDLMAAPRIVDIAIASAYQLMWSNDSPAETLAGIVQGYETHQRLTADEIDMLPTLCMGRLVQSLTIGAARAAVHTTNHDYILLHAAPVTAALQTLGAVGDEAIRNGLREALER
jgi:Ser/Thr protein kinase RdoA (MazF antagonist)